MFSAAPILKLSATHQKEIPFSKAKFFLILPTNTGSTPDASLVVGYSKFSGLSITVNPNEFFRISRTSSGLTGFSNSISTASECPLYTGTLAAVQEIGKSCGKRRNESC